MPAARRDHPSYNDMIKAALLELKDRKGSSYVAIIRKVSVMHNIPETVCRQYVRLSLKRGVIDGTLIQVSGIGASGSFKLSAAAKKPTAFKSKKVLATKKSPAKKSPAKKSVVKKSSPTMKAPKRKVKTSKSSSKATKLKKISKSTTAGKKSSSTKTKAAPKPRASKKKA